MAQPTGKVPDQPTVDGAKCQFSPLGTHPSARDVVQYPAHFGRGEIRIQHQASHGGDCILHATLDQSAAPRSGSAVLPDDGRMNRLARRPLPHNHCLALVGDADGCHIPRTCACPPQRLNRAGELACQDLHWIVLDPPRLRVELLELMLRNRCNRARFVKENRPGTGRPLVQGKNVTHVRHPPSGTSQTRGAAFGQEDQKLRCNRFSSSELPAICHGQCLTMQAKPVGDLCSLQNV